MAHTIPPTLNDGDDLTEDFTVKVATAITELQKLRSGGETGVDSVGPTVGTAVLTATTVTVAAPGVAGRIEAWGKLKWTQTVGGDGFQITLNIGGTLVGYEVEPGGGGSPPPASLSAGLTVNGLANVDITLTIARTSGTGTATAVDDQRSGLHYIFVPAP